MRPLVYSVSVQQLLVWSSHQPAFSLAPASLLTRDTTENVILSVDQLDGTQKLVTVPPGVRMIIDMIGLSKCHSLSKSLILIARLKITTHACLTIRKNLGPLAGTTNRMAIQISSALAPGPA